MEDNKSIACPSCLSPNQSSAINCRVCGASMAGNQTLDPLGAIQGEGAMWRGATTGRPKPIVLIVVWLVFLPVLVISIGSAVNMFRAGNGMSEFLFFLMFIAFAFVAIVFLFRTTRNYLTIPAKTFDEPEATHKKITLRKRPESKETND